MSYSVLNEIQFRKISDLRRLYGLASLANLICINKKLLELAFQRKEGCQVYGWNDRVTKSIIYGINKYWRPHMSKLQKGISSEN